MDKAIAIITARGGSKRIPRKNIRPFLGKPIIAYSIEAALQSGLFSEIMVSTDDKEIADIATRYGASVPFLRSNENASDKASTAAVVAEVLEQYALQGRVFEFACCLYPTAPFVTADTLQRGFAQLDGQQLDTLFPVCRFSFPILRALVQTDDGRVVMKWPEYMLTRSQDLEPAFHDAGQFYWLRVGSFLQTRQLYTAKSGALEMSELEVQDIDNETDWKLAELKYQLLQATPPHA